MSKGRVNGTSVWLNYCDEVTHKESVVCNCFEISPTSLYDETTNLIDDKLANAFRSEGLNAISTLNFLNSSAFYIIVGLSLFYLIFLFWSIRKDKSDLSLVVPL